ncbi:MAG: cyanophycin synthetase, partial [Prolixibacteraceae bacterium]
TKTELYRFLEQNDGTIFINNANPFLADQAKEVKNVGYTTSKTFDGLEGEIISANPFLMFKVLFPKGWLYIKTNLVGGYNLENTLAAATIGEYFGIDPTEIVSAIEGYQPDNNRSQMVLTKNNRLLMDAYNANPSSTKAALENFDRIESAKKGVMLGDMLELGTVSRDEHQKIVDFLGTLKLDLVFLVGPHYSACNLPSTFQHFNHSEELATFLRSANLSDYLLLIKGSRGMKLETIRPEL